MSLSNKDKTYYEFFPENKVTHLSLLLDPIKTPKLQKLFSLIRHDDKDQAKRISNTQNAIRELIEINSFLGIQRKEDIPGDIIFHGHNYGANIFDINNTYISCLKYLNCLDAFFETRELVPSQVKRYTKPQLGTIINDIAHMSRKNEEVYIYSDETTYGTVVSLYLHLIKNHQEEHDLLISACEKYIDGSNKSLSLESKNQYLSEIHLGCRF
ncbi:hypothetical protein [Cobetia sp. 29-18-1]|uniref:hypothetical protein n=1 Tax=Cobetia sp. 29-18-1 TaxID=3040018 RepID=UPI00244B549A|nr:hypothetical protein [Cobetia sp. 29-18-1]MDH2299125.1 hypothetical protein [Cobetia sp. 29-18-1]